MDTHFGLVSGFEERFKKELSPLMGTLSIGPSKNGGRGFSLFLLGRRFGGQVSSAWIRQNRSEMLLMGGPPHAKASICGQVVFHL
jgi:hypothetical protein